MIYDKNMGWALVPTSWFSTEYKLHFSNLSTYRLIDNFNCKQTIMDSHTTWPTQKTILNYHHKPWQLTTVGLNPKRQTTTALNDTTTQSTWTPQTRLIRQPDHTNWKTNYHGTQVDNIQPLTSTGNWTSQYYFNTDFDKGFISTA